MNLEHMRSLSSPAIKVRFWNIAKCVIEVIWIDFHGRQQLYTCLEHRQFLDVNTFLHHYWVFKNKQAGSYLRANKNRYFCAANEKIDDLHKRHVVFILNFSLPTLKTLSIDYITKLMSGNCMYVKNLEIPRTLKKDILRKMHVVFKNHRNIDDKKKCETSLDPDTNSMIECEMNLNSA